MIDPHTQAFIREHATDDVRTLDLFQLQTALRDRGVVLHESEL